MGFSQVKNFPAKKKNTGAYTVHAPSFVFFLFFLLVILLVTSVQSAPFSRQKN